MKYELPKLGFEYGDLEPFMDSKTVEIHYSKHHQTYCDKLNEAIGKHPEIDKSAEELLANLNALPEDIRTAAKNFGGGFVNHNFFWSILAKPGQKCSGKILKAIEKDFGGLDAFREKFSDAAVKVFGSGWAWLVLDRGKLSIMTTANQDSPLSLGFIPLLTIDVWEHSYYLKYMNKRADFISAWWNIVSWKKVEENYKLALKK